MTDDSFGRTMFDIVMEGMHQAGEQAVSLDRTLRIAEVAAIVEQAEALRRIAAVLEAFDEDEGGSR